ncbi:MAG: flavin reductase family protein [Burkholderiaceae bacterium]|jgi:flavin reductase (DIM6/NTAB) family NADH-FMN oxidoreductase RutF
MTAETKLSDPSDSKAFRQALGCFPTGVTIITGRDPETQAAVGLTVSSFNSLSLNPPLVLWSISSRSPSLAAFGPGRSQCIHVLSAQQADLARHFATPKPDKFEGVPLRTDRPAEAPPQLEDCCVVFDCVTDRLIEAGDHFLVIAQVRGYQAFAADSLVFCKSLFLSSDSLSRISG